MRDEDPSVITTYSAAIEHYRPRHFTRHSGRNTSTKTAKT